MKDIGIPEFAGKEVSEAVFLSKLRRATAEKHSLLESQDLLAALMSQEVTMRHYTSHLLLMQKIHQSFEQKVLPKIAFLFPDIDTLIVSPYISTDLHCLREQVADIKPGEFILTDDNPTVAYALGYLYVLEGSKLGGKVIFKHLQKRLNISGEQGGRFLTDNGTDTGSNWKNFLAVFAGYVTDRQVEDEAISGANDAFTSIYEYYQSNTVSNAF